MRIACALLTATLLLGCGSPKPKDTAKKAVPEKPKEEYQPRQVTTEAGDLTYRPPGSNGKPLWNVSWKHADLRMGDDKKLGATLQGLSGTLYDEKGESSRFTADSGEADQATGNLLLTGNVVVKSIEQESTLRCAEVRYASKGRRLVRARGGVLVNGPWGLVSGLQEVVTTPDLKTFATPDLFPST